jgi:UDP-GlcNAc:undecaprenyl-phosphate GlcNAc-1-phosphate transferase
MIFLSTLLISMFVTIALIPMLKTAALRLNRGLDKPGGRKIHDAPKPRIGGIAVAIGTLLPVLLWAETGHHINAIMIGAWIIVLFGAADDFKRLGWRTKFIGQILAAAVIVFYGGIKICNLGVCMPEDTLLPDIVSVPLTLLVIVGVTNAINLSDGLDGLAGGISLLMFICIGYLAYSLSSITNSLFEVTLSIAVIGSIIGFLRYNTYPATVFMGDTGSQLLGFLAVTLSVCLTQNNQVISPALPLLLIGFPILDTLTVMVERISHGRSPFAADNNHFHHKLIRIGLFHTEAVVAIYAISAFLIISGFILRHHSEWLLLGFYAVFSILVLTAFAYFEKTEHRLNREGVFDIRIKQRLLFLKDRAVLIRVVFAMLQVLLPLILLAVCIIPGTIPKSLSMGTIPSAVLVLFLWAIKTAWLLPVMRFTYYLIVPVLVFLASVHSGRWVEPAILDLYQLSFAITAILLVMTLKFTRRQKGFRISPMDFLILIIALVVPNLPDPRLQSLHLGSLAAATIVLYYAFEVFNGEQRGHYEKLTLYHLTLLVVVSVRGFI